MFHTVREQQPQRCGHPWAWVYCFLPGTVDDTFTSLTVTCIGNLRMVTCSLQVRELLQLSLSLRTGTSQTWRWDTFQLFCKNKLFNSTTDHIWFCPCISSPPPEWERYWLSDHKMMNNKWKVCPPLILASTIPHLLSLPLLPSPSSTLYVLPHLPSSLPASTRLSSLPPASPPPLSFSLPLSPLSFPLLPPHILPSSWRRLSVWWEMLSPRGSSVIWDQAATWTCASSLRPAWRITGPLTSP